MVAPGSAGASFEVLLQFSLDEEAQRRIENRTSTIADELKRIQAQAKDTGKAINEGFKAGAEGVKQTDEALKKVGKTAEETARKVNLEIRNLRAQARVIIQDVRLLRDQADDIDRWARPLAVGGALVAGGIFAAASKYVQDATEATQVTREWAAAQSDLERSGSRIGAVLAQEALPLLKQAATVTKQVAGILEAHPEAAKAALYGGLLATAVGSLASLRASGLRLFADIKLDRAMALQMTAAQLQLQASENQLRAAGIQAQASGGGTVAKSASLSPIAAGGILAGGALFAGIGSAASQAGAKLFGTTPVQFWKDMLDEEKKTVAIWAFDFGNLFGGNGKKLFDDVSKALGLVKEIQTQAAQTQSFIGGSRDNQDAAVKAFSDWRTEDARIVQDAMQERKRIVAEGEKEIADITRSFVSQRTSIERQYSQEAAQITTRFQEESKKTERDYIKERSELIKDGAERIREIQQEEQEKREDIERDFAKSAAKATRDRDALALKDAEDARAEALAEAGRGTQDAIAKEKRETQERLAELQSRHAQERQQRQAQYEQDLKENAARRAQALKEADEHHQAELKQAREANNQKLKDLDESANQERARRREQLNAQLQDLGIVFNSERQLRNNAYNDMLSDFQSWLQRMNATFGQSASSLGTASGGTAGTTTTSTNPNFPGLYHDYSGYAYKGLYRMAQDGKPEWVVGGNDTRAAERAIGGQLTQQNMAQMIGLMAALQGSKQYVDNTVYGKDMTTRQIRDLREESARRLDRMLGGY
jgi:hypothetical protein